MTDRQLLERYVPYLRYDSLESYRADSAAVLPEHASADWAETNALKRRGGSVIAEARPRAAGTPVLDLAFLARSAYPGGAPVRRDDYLDAVGRDYVRDAAEMHARPGYADVCHGHLVRPRDGTVWLQYWFFYYDNDKTYFGIGAHEGDWEMIQLRMGPDGVPSVATYAQHDRAQALRWTELDRRNAAGVPVPVVFVGRGSHASFARAGEHYPLPLPAPDYADGRGPRVRPRLAVIGNSGPPWARWPGVWGSSDSSPRGPSEHGQWSDPSGFHRDAAARAGARARAETRLAAAPRPAPPPPRIAAARVGGHAVVSYRFPSRLRAGTARPAWLVVSLDTPDDARPPATHGFPVHAAAGAVAHPTPLADDRRYVVRAAAYAEDQTASGVVSTTLPAG